MKIITVEEHFHTKEYLKYVRSRTDIPKKDYTEEAGRKIERTWWTPNNYFVAYLDQPNKWLDTGEARLKDMDDAGVNMQVLSLGSPGIEPFDASDATPLASVINDELSEIVKRNPTRFAGFATIAPQNPEAAAAELERAVLKLGLKGAMISGNIRGEYLDEPKYRVILETAAKLRVPIYLHPRMPAADMIKPYLTYPELGHAMWGYAAEAGLHSMRLICSGVFDTYPDLKIILGHLGESIPFWLWRIRSRSPRTERGTDSQPARNLKKSRNQYFKDNFYVSNSGMYWEPVTQFVCSAIGADRMMFATDYPTQSLPEAVQFIKTVQISNDDREKICHLTAEKILSL